jgi:MFS family permease
MPGDDRVVRRLWQRWNSGVWRRPDFRALFAAQTGAVFGTLISRTAIPFAAIIELNASPLQLSLLGASSMAPAFGLGLFAGAWVDRVPRKPLMIACDLIRAAVLLIIPLLWWLDQLSMLTLYLVVAAISICSVVFDIAYRSILPSIVKPDELLDGNSRLTGSGSVAEAASFSLGGWLVQLLTAPGAVVINAITFLWSARWLRRITLDERARPKDQHAPILLYSLLMELSFNMFGAIFLLFVVRELGFEPGVLGVIFALGGLAAIGGAAIAGRVTSALGFRRTIVVMTVLMAIGQGSVALATGVTVFAVVVLIVQQFLVDGPYTVVDINTATIRQLAASEQWQGRINSSVRVLEFGGGLIGTIAAGVIAESIGLRPVLIGSAGLILLCGLVVRQLAEPATDPVAEG